MSISDCIALLGIIVTAFLTFVSLWQSKTAINLTKQSIEEANRPYVVLYYDETQTVHSIHTYLIIKNFGNTGAYIESVTASPKIGSYPVWENNPFELFSNHFIAPKQSVTSTIFVQGIDHHKQVADRVYLLKYRDMSGNKYEERFVFDETDNYKRVFSMSNPSDNQSIESVIAKSFQELIRRLMKL